MKMPNPEIPQNVTPDMQTVSSAYSDIIAHNKTYTGHVASIKALMSYFLDSPEGINEDGTTESVNYTDVGQEQDLVVEGDMDADLQDIFHSDTFFRAGIRIAPAGMFLTQMTGRRETSPELVPVIENTVLFTEFLSSVQPEDMKGNEGEKFLSDTLAALAGRASMCFDVKNQSGLSRLEKELLAEAGEDTLRTFAAIDPEYARLGLDSAARRQRVEDISEELSEHLTSGRSRVLTPERRAEYDAYTYNLRSLHMYEHMANQVHYWGRGLLQEYLEAHHGSYLTPPAEQGFGPASWHKDVGQSYWQDALDFLRRLDENERTRTFAGEVRDNLVASVDFALRELESPDPNIYWRSQAGDLANIRNALSGEQYDDAKLAAYVKKPDYRA